MHRIEIGANIVFYEEESAFSGVQKVAENVKKDIKLVTGHHPKAYVTGKTYEQAVIYGTVDRSPLLKRLEQQGKLDLSSVRGKWEVYSFSILSEPVEGIKNALVIAGSDKRGTIYGLYHLSETIGVSPLVNWNHVWPAKKEKIVLTEAVNMVSKVPSVKYRGFFINDEWPAFGNWAKTHFGGINAHCYEKIFELLLRLKGNYLWPAMWRSNFSLDGPGLLNAELADEYGVVVSTSHHEPCMRSGGEYGMVRGKDSVYGDAWNFNKNPEGITRFWRDGLLRNKSFENNITIGMRGENDTAILGKSATLEENISLLHKVLHTQNQLIRETINPDLTQVPRQFVLFTEIESFFYGNDTTPGLMNDPELDGVTLMLSDNNHGSTRTLPSQKMRNHNGGYGMYYHMDMNGGAHSFKWIGSTYLPKLWEQMTMAYEYGVREIWVTNIGDIGTQEFGLSYFLDLAYDIDTWGGRDASVTDKYTKQWLRTQFGSTFQEPELLRLRQIVLDYTSLLSKRKHEVMNAEVYHPVHFGEAEEVLQTSLRIQRSCDSLKAECPANQLAAYISLIYFPACGTANLMKMWILAGRNALYAKQNRVEANAIADEVNACFQKDECLVEEYHSIDEGYFNGFGLSEHIGFRSWNEDNNQYPLLLYVHPANHPRMIVSRVEDEHYVIGSRWVDQQQVWRNCLRPDVDDILFDVACGSKQAITYQIETGCPWMSFSSVAGVVGVQNRITLHIHREQFHGKVTGSFTIYNVGYSKTQIQVEAENLTGEEPENVFIEKNNYIAMEASHYQVEHSVGQCGFQILRPYGRTGSAIKVFPVTSDFLKEAERPFVEYHFIAEHQGRYKVQFFMAATTPVVFESKQYIGFSVNEEVIRIFNTVKEENRPFFSSAQWSREAHDNIKIFDDTVECQKGKNKLRFWGMSPAIVLERIVLYPEGSVLPSSYLGPQESYFTGEKHHDDETSLT